MTLPPNQFAGVDADWRSESAFAGSVIGVGAAQLLSLLLGIMKTTLVIFLLGLLLCSCSQKQKTPVMTEDFVETNGEYVTIGNILVKTNSPLNTDKFKQFKWREEELWKIKESHAPDAIDKFIEGAWALAKDYPDEANGYQDIMAATEDYGYLGQPDRAQSLAKKLINSQAPEQFKIWAKGFLNRLDSIGKPVSLQFTAVDGRAVDLANMKGKVVLVDFWQSDQELPRVKAAYDKFHGRGFEVIGIYCYTDKERMNSLIQEIGQPWPQFFDGQNGEFTQDFGIDGIPHMFLVDKKGCMRFDNVRARDNVHTKGDTTSFEEKISDLLTEP
jgi:Redoxin